MFGKLISCKIILLLSILFSFNLLAQSQTEQPKKYIALSIEDLLTQSYGVLKLEDQKVYFLQLLEALEKEEVKAMGFAIGNAVAYHQEDLLQQFLDKGHTIGNKTFSNPDLNDRTAAFYRQDIVKVDSVLQSYEQTQKFFRYPFLHQGNTQAKKDSVKSFLDSLGYQLVPVTIDTDDYRYNREYVQAKFVKGEVQAEDIGRKYVQAILQQSNKADHLATETFGKKVKHILQIRANYLNAHYLQELIRTFKADGWAFITVEEALQDSIYQLPEYYVGELGISHTKRIRESLNPINLNDFFTENSLLDLKVEKVFQSLTDKERIAQLIIVAGGRLGKPTSVVNKLVREKKVGGVLLLNGTVQSGKDLIKNFNEINEKSGGLPLLYSADAEPSLVNRKIQNTRKVKKANQVKSSEESAAIAQVIAEDLLDMGIKYNYAPVSDVSSNNAAIGNRSFSNNKDTVIRYNKAFIAATQALGVVATAKHFPGHGLVTGDSHHTLPVIDGEMQEVPIYDSLIREGVVSIMVGHIAVKNNEKYNTDGFPASISRPIITDLLKQEMGFKGIVTTDAMGMGAVQAIPDAPLKALQAGVDILLMPVNEDEVIKSVMQAIEEDANFKAQIYTSVRKVIRLKVCLEVIEKYPF